MDEIKAEELSALIQVIHEKTGLNFANEKEKFLKKKVVEALDTLGFRTASDLLESTNSDVAFVYQLVNIFTRESHEMFSPVGQWLSLKEDLLEMAGRKKKLRVWHVGCSAGEELFTLNIILEELGIRPSFKFLVTDMNEEALIRSASGRYKTEDIQQYQNRFTRYDNQGDLKKYFHLEGSIACMNPNLLQNVRFRKHNFIFEQMNEQFDLILCREGMDYLDQVEQRKILKKFHKNLLSKGLFVSNFSEARPLIPDSSLYVPKNPESGIFYKN